MSASQFERGRLGTLSRYRWALAPRVTDDSWRGETVNKNQTLHVRLWKLGHKLADEVVHFFGSFGHEPVSSL